MNDTTTSAASLRVLTDEIVRKRSELHALLVEFRERTGRVIAETSQPGSVQRSIPGEPQV